MTPILYFAADAEPLAARYAALAELVHSTQPPHDNVGFALWHDAQRLHLVAPERASAHRSRRAASTAARLSSVGLQELQRRVRGRSLLQRACGDVSGRRVFDAMGGWGVDALVLAAHGASVCVVERQPLLHLLTLDLCRRAEVAGLIAAGAVTPLLADAWPLLTTDVAQYPADIVYLDPMFPLRRKGALPGKRLQWLAQLACEPPAELGPWIDAGLASGAQRTVLKRRLKGPVVRTPAWSLRGRTSRFDVYRP